MEIKHFLEALHHSGGHSIGPHLEWMNMKSSVVYPQSIDRIIMKTVVFVTPESNIYSITCHIRPFLKILCTKSLSNDAVQL